MALFPGTPKLVSQNCPETLPGGVPRLWELIAPDCKVRLRRGLNQSCSSPWELFNAMSHFWIRHREEVDSWLLVVGSQTISLTLGPSFAHNLGCRCPNDQCEAILDIYASRSFQWHQEHFNVKCFVPCCRTLKIRESQKTPSPQFWECEFHPHTWPKWGCENLALRIFFLTKQEAPGVCKPLVFFLQMFENRAPKAFDFLLAHGTNTLGLEASSVFSLWWLNYYTL
jgi:hypothetical protein